MNIDNWSYTFKNLDDLLADLQNLIKFHDECYSEDKYYKAYSDYKKTGGSMSFSENSHVFTGKLNDLIVNKCCIKNLNYKYVKLDILDECFLLTVETTDNTIVHKIKIQ